MRRPVRMLLLLLCLDAGLLCLGARPASAGLAGDQAFSTGDFAAAYRDWSQSAAAGDASAMSALGTLYDTGHGVGQDFAVALDWYRRAAEAGNVRAMFNVGAMYDNGRGTPVDRAEAIRWYDRAASRHNGRAAYALGLIYRDGDGVPRNRAKAIRYFRLASDDGLGAARTNLLAMGAGPTRVVGQPRPAPAAPIAPPAAVAGIPSMDTVVLEIARFQKAALARGPLDPQAATRFNALVPTLVEQAAKGNTLAQYDVGYAYEHGDAVPRDPVRAYVNYLRASSSTEANVKAAALKGASDVGSTLTAEQHAAARDMLIDGTP